jgi:hypothetical protein
MLDSYNYFAWPPGGRLFLGDEEVKVGEREDSPPTTLAAMVDAVVGWAKLAEAEGATLDAKKIWRHPEASPAVLLLMILDRYGQEALEWELETLKLTLERDGLKPSGTAWTKIMAGVTLLLSPSPWRQWEVFHWVTRGLAGLQPNMVFLEVPEPGHLLAGYELMQVFDPKRETSYEVDKFIAAAFRNEGIPYIPEPLSFAQRELEEAKIECLNCGAVHRDDDDVRCVTCESEDLVKIPYEHAELRDATKEWFERLRKLKLPKALEKLEEAPEQAQAPLRRLLLHADYAKWQHRRTTAQLRGL